MKKYRSDRPKRSQLDIKLEKAREAIDEVFSDTSVDRATTRDALWELRDDISIKLGTLKDE